MPTRDDDDELPRLVRSGRRDDDHELPGLGSLAQHLLVNDGKGASQSVPHVHIHVIPRYGGDTLHTLARLAWHITTLTVPRRETPERRSRLEAAAAAIRDAL